MPGSFFDTNVLIHLASADFSKADRAEAVLRQGGGTSVQVLNEFADIARRKLAFTWAETHEYLSSLRGLLAVHPVTVETHEIGLQLSERYPLSIFDAMIAAAALLADCDKLLSEDMHEGLSIDGRLRIVNPFEAQP